MTNEEIIKIRQETKPSNTTNWADTLAFARALLKHYDERKQNEKMANRG